LVRKEELQKISKTHYDLVISDMNREDDEHEELRFFRWDQINKN